MRFPDEIWKLIIEGVVWKTEERAIKLINYHAMMPYMLSLHNLKGFTNNLQYHKTKNNWIFDLLGEDEVTQLINQAISKAIIMYN